MFIRSHFSLYIVQFTQTIAIKTMDSHVYYITHLKILISFKYCTLLFINTNGKA